MNRLWVRIALVIAGLLLFIALVPPLFNLLLGDAAAQATSPRFVEVWQSLSPDVQQELASAFRESASRLLLRLLLGAVGVATVAGILLSRMLTAPLQNLQAGAQAVARRELSYRVPEQGSDETRAVARAFNQMAARLAQSEDARRSMLSDVAHELRHPVHIIQGNLQAILDDVYPMNKEEIGRLVNQTRHLSTLVNDLHELAQAEAQQLPLHKQPADIANLVKETAAQFKSTAAGRQIALQVSLLGAMPGVDVDGRRIRQALSNLLHNALQHTPAGGTISVVVERESARLSIRVRDSGSGLTVEQLPRVFDRFYRGDVARSRDQEGTGLGLAIARAIVEMHEGQLIAASDGPGLGSTFTIQLPLAAGS